MVVLVVVVVVMVTLPRQETRFTRWRASLRMKKDGNLGKEGGGAASCDGGGRHARAEGALASKMHFCRCILLYSLLLLALLVIWAVDE